MAKSSSKNAPKEVQEENPWKSWMGTQLTFPVVAAIAVQWLVVIGLMVFFVGHEQIRNFVDEFDLWVTGGFSFLSLVTLISLAYFPSMCARIPVNCICCLFLTLSQAFLMTVIALVASASTAITVTQMLVCNVFFLAVMVYSVPLLFFGTDEKQMKD